MKDKIYKIQSPDIHSIPKNRDFFNLFNQPDILNAMDKADLDYLHWESLKHKSWIPTIKNLSKEEFWYLLRQKRFFESMQTPICDKDGFYFKMNPRNYSEFLHIVDKEMAGNFMGIADFSENNKQQFINRNMIDESIASSQLEGANTTRAVAKKMLLEGRKPTNKSETMIVNNHKAMLAIENGLYQKELSFDLICELHSIITDGSIPEDKKGKIRETFDENGQELKIMPWSDNEITYIAPPKEFVEKELPKLIDFANDKKIDKGEGFTHPIIKAIMLHFWIGLLHPFEDGNGRLARIIFYWYVLRHEYWAFKYLSLSEKIKKSSQQYSMAYIYSEQDACDLTYFIHYNIEKIKLARRDFQEYIKKVVKENRYIMNFNRNKYHFNERQIALLHYFYQKTENNINLKAYQQLYSVKKGAAILDLTGLLDKGFLSKEKHGRNTYYFPTKSVDKLFDGIK